MNLADSTYQTPIVAVRISIPAKHVPNGERLWPSGNRIGSLMLARAFEYALASEKLIEEPVAASGELNESLFTLKVRERVQGVQIVLAVLDRVKLKTLSQVFCFDPMEIIWRAQYPAETPDLLNPFLGVETEAEALEKLRGAFKGKPLSE